MAAMNMELILHIQFSVSPSLGRYSIPCGALWRMPSSGTTYNCQVPSTPLILPGVVPRVLGGAVHDTPAVVMMSATVLSAATRTWYVLCCLVGVEVMIRVTDISLMVDFLLVSSTEYDLMLAPCSLDLFI